MKPDSGEEEDLVVIDISRRMTREEVVESILCKTDPSDRGRN